MFTSPAFRTATLAACLALAAPLAAHAADTVARADANFMKKAAVGGVMEVKLGEVAQKNAEHDAVKQFGARMVEDHSKANSKLIELAKTKGVDLPPADDEKVKKQVAELEGKTGAAFDRAYMKHMVEDHKKDVNAFEKQAKSGKDAEVKAFAAETLPTLREHKKLAETTYNSVKASGSAKSGMK